MVTENAAFGQHFFVCNRTVIYVKIAQFISGTIPKRMESFSTEIVGIL
jgi:hypothetical protein